MCTKHNNYFKPGEADVSFKLFKTNQIHNLLLQTKKILYIPNNALCIFPSPPPQQHPSEETGRGAFISQQSGKRGNIIHHSIHSANLTLSPEQSSERNNTPCRPRFCC